MGLKRPLGRAATVSHGLGVYGLVPSIPRAGSNPTTSTMIIVPHTSKKTYAELGCGTIMFRYDSISWLKLDVNVFLELERHGVDEMRIRIRQTTLKSGMVMSYPWDVVIEPR